MTADIELSAAERVEGKVHSPDGSLVSNEAMVSEVGIPSMIPPKQKMVLPTTVAVVE